MGVNLAVIWHEAPGANVVLHVVVREKSPFILMLDRVSVEEPEFVIVYVCDDDVPVTIRGNCCAGVRKIDVPVPVSCVTCGLLGSLSLTEIVPVRVPLAVALKFTVIMQLAPFASVVGQLFVCEKSPLAVMPFIVIVAPLRLMKLSFVVVTFPRTPIPTLVVELINGHVWVCRMTPLRAVCVKSKLSVMSLAK